MTKAAPHEVLRQHMEALVNTGNSLAQRLSSLKVSGGEIDLAGEIGRKWLPDHYELIKSAENLLKLQGSAQQIQLLADSGNWLKEIGEAVANVATGRRKGEISLGMKKRWLGQLVKDSSTRSVKALIVSVNRTLARIQLDVAKLEAVWKPRGKLIEGGRLLEGQIEIENIVKSVRQGPLIVCDPHCSARTLSILEAASPDIEIMLLTVNIYDRTKLDEHIQTSRRSGRRIQIGLANPRGGPVPHDRFIVSPDHAWSIGASIKDIGKKDTLIAELDDQGATGRLLREYFEGRRGKVTMI